MAKVLFIRHAQAAGQSAETQLTDLGRDQARALSGWLRQRYDIDRVIASPYQRAQDTIAPFARDTGIEVETEPRIAERRAGSYIEPHGAWLETMRLGFAELDSRVDGGESGREAQTRGAEAVQEALRASNALTVMVSHGQLMTHTLASIDPGFGFEAWQALTNPDVYLIESAPEGGLRFERVWD